MNQPVYFIQCIIIDLTFDCLCIFLDNIRYSVSKATLHNSNYSDKILHRQIHFGYQHILQ